MEDCTGGLLNHPPSQPEDVAGRGASGSGNGALFCSWGGGGAVSSVTLVEPPMSTSPTAED